MTLQQLLTLHFYIIMYEHTHYISDKQFKDSLENIKQKIIDEAMEL